MWMISITLKSPDIGLGGFELFLEGIKSLADPAEVWYWVSDPDASELEIVVKFLFRSPQSGIITVGIKDLFYSAFEVEEFIVA